VEDRSIAKTCIRVNYETIKKIRSVVLSDNRPSVIVPEANNYEDLHDSNILHMLLGQLTIILNYLNQLYQ
jgi:hypothetical protein